MVAVAAAVGTLLTSCAGAKPLADPASYHAGLWPQRPVVELSFDMAPDLSSVTGRESIVFTPDIPTCELVFRAWPNNPTMSKAGSSLTVTDTSIDGRPVVSEVTDAGAPARSPGTLIEVPLARCLEPGQSVRAELGFRLVLGADADERVGYSPGTQTAWFGSGFPMLAWVRGSGWARDPAVVINGESATSEDFTLSTLSVTAPTGYRVMGTGTATGDGGGRTAGEGTGRTAHRFTAPAVRDVTVAIGRYDVLDRDIGGVRLHLATPQAGTRAEPQEWADEIDAAITRLTKVFGPFPYPEFWVTITPGQSDGTEFPAALQFGDVRPRQLGSLVAHEVAHQWFYSLVGNNQAEHPWLDESLATLGEAVASSSDYQYGDISRRVAGRMGRPMSYWADNGGYQGYTEGVYDQGAAVLLEARRQVGADRFDTVLRSYIAANAHQVATPADFAHAFAAQPKVLDLLGQAGALPNDR
ncbi:MAG: M1 family aminopeptidase [Pseudonocardiaceae bacterium]